MYLSGNHDNRAHGICFPSLQNDTKSANLKQGHDLIDYAPWLLRTRLHTFHLPQELWIERHIDEAANAPIIAT